jgi:hypothetical protein
MLKEKRDTPGSKDRRSEEVKESCAGKCLANYNQKTCSYFCST